MDEAGLHHNDRTTGFPEALRGDGFLTPGGPTAGARVLDGRDLSGARVPGIGCGSGGLACAPAARRAAAGVAGLARQIRTPEAMPVVRPTGAHCPHRPQRPQRPQRIRARKPA